MERIIGRYTGKLSGPLLICLAGIHGNELAGVQALEELFGMLEREPDTNPDFEFRGRLVGIRANLRALASGQRFLEKDLNRQFTDTNVSRIKRSPSSMLKAEDLEMKELLETIEFEIADFQPEQFYLMDLHTTSADGGIFTITSNDERSIRIGEQLQAPVITGLLKDLSGTTLQYFTTQNMGVPTVAVTFEAGQHYDPLSAKRTIAAIVNCLRTIGCVSADHVENRHDQLLQDHARNLPKVAKLIKMHKIRVTDEFRMLPGFQNFQPVKAGQLLAHDRNGPIHADYDAHILMPHYQKQGEDGFFLIKTVK